MQRPTRSLTDHDLFDVRMSTQEALAMLRCQAHPVDAVPRLHAKRVLVLGDGPDLGRAVLQWYAESEVSLLCSAAQLAGLEREDRFLLMELVAEDELTLLDGDTVARVGIGPDGRCEVCLEGPEECCALYDRLVLCGDETLACSAPQRSLDRAG
ncbi:MAG: hypothetical protein H6831_06070 [Planctomycetes bacterium]|nr:hypothetical protein [Planctomycetota bacterium]MCB9903958.1 hypothetical protein [Planctomycetota bacterium]